MQRVRAGFLTCFTLSCLVVGCGGGGEKGDLSFEIGTELATAGQCNGSIAAQLSPCISVQLFRHVDGRREPVPLYRLDEADRAPEAAAFTLRFQGRDIGFDAVEDPADPLAADTRVDLEIRVWDDSGEPAFGATLEDVALGDVKSRPVRLYPFRRWACPGPAAQDGADLPTARALHAAVPLPNGDVLVFGGVSGTAIDPASVLETSRRGALLMRTIELYDASAHRFRSVGGSFGRVMFGHAYLGAETDAEGRVRHRIRVIGGLQLAEGVEPATTVVRFDNTGTLGGPLGVPVAPAIDAAEGPAVDLVFDPEAMTVTVEEAPEGPLGGAYVRASDFLGEDPDAAASLVLVGLGRPPATWGPSGEFYLLQRDGVSLDDRALLAGRVGATVEPLTEFGSYLIWGGNAGHGEGSASISAGELQFVSPTTAPVRLSSGGGRPLSTAFHSSTPLPEDRTVFLIAGGYLVADDGSIYSETSPTPLVALEGSALGVTARSIAATDYTPTIFHTATPLDVRRGILLVGGATERDGNRLAPTGQVGRVVGGAYEDVTHVQEGADVPSPLNTPRWGHTTTPLPGRRILVLGGFGADAVPMPANALRALREPELLYDEPAPEPLLAGQCRDLQEVPDAGDGDLDASLPPTADAGPPDAGPSPLDAGPPDAGPLPDAGPPPPDAG